MSEQELRSEETEVEEPQPTDWEERLNAAVAERYSDTPDEELPEEEDAPTEPSEEEPPEDDDPPQEPSQTEDPDVEYGRRVATVLKARPDLAEALVALERGDAVAMPREVMQAVQAYREQQAPTTPEEDPDDAIYADPFAVIKELREKVSTFEAYQTQQFQAQRQREDQQNISLIESVGEEFRASHPELSEEQFFRELIPDIAQTNLIVKYRGKHPGDSRAAVKAAFEAAYRMNYPELAQKAQIDKQIRDNRRARRAGATAASPRSVQRTREEPKTRTDRVAAFAEDLRDAMQANA